MIDTYGNFFKFKHVKKMFTILKQTENAQNFKFN